MGHIIADVSTMYAATTAAGSAIRLDVPDI
jgi:hypothetical protein